MDAGFTVSVDTCHISAVTDDQNTLASRSKPDSMDFVLAQQSRTWTINRSSFDIERRTVQEQDPIEESVDSNPVIIETRAGSNNALSRIPSLFRRAITLRGNSATINSEPSEEKQTEVVIVNSRL